MGYSHHTESCSQSNPNSIDAWFLDGFDPRDLKSANPWPAKFWKYHAAIRYIVGRVAVEQTIEARKRKGADGWIAMRWEDAHRLFPDSVTYGKIRKELLGRKVLVCDEIYEEGSKSKWYKLGNDWLCQGVSLSKVTDRRLIRKIVNVEDVRSNRRFWDLNHYHLDGCLKLVRVDESLTNRWTCQRYRSHKQNLTWLKIIQIQSGITGLKVDCYGRVHHVVGNSRRVIRSAFRIDGSPLAEIDVCNAQPLLIGYLAAKVISEEWTIDQVRELGRKLSKGNMFHGYIRLAKGTEKEGTRENTKAGKEGTKSRRNLNLCMSSITNGLPLDLLDFIRICEQGAFYRTLAELWGLDYDKCQHKIKRIVFRLMLFGRTHKYHPYWKLVRERWPTIAAFLEIAKEEDKGVASRACQCLESSIVIGGVIDRFRVSFPEIPVLTIHDSLLVPPDAIGIAKDTILDTFGVLGLKPTLKIKSYRPHDLILRGDGHRALDKAMDEAIERDWRNDG